MEDGEAHEPRSRSCNTYGRSFVRQFTSSSRNDRSIGEADSSRVEVKRTMGCMPLFSSPHHFACDRFWIHSV
jgi:hypothetical protein